MRFIKTIHGSYVNADGVDYMYIGEADFNGETGYTVDAVSGDKTDTLYFSADKAEAELFLGWLVDELGGDVGLRGFEAHQWAETLIKKLTKQTE